MTNQLYLVRRRLSNGKLRTLQGIPTPMLISKGGGPAWKKYPESSVWYAKEDTDPKGVKYIDVVIERNPQHQ